VESIGCSENLLTLLMPKDDFNVAEKTKRHVKLSAKNTDSNGWPFKSQVFFRVHWAIILVPEG
jgi:hypothetical protein